MHFLAYQLIWVTISVRGMLENSVWQFFQLTKLILKGNSCLQPGCELANFILQIFEQNNYAIAGVKRVNPDSRSWWCTGCRYSCSSETKSLVYYFFFFVSGNGITVQLSVHFVFMDKQTSLGVLKLVVLGYFLMLFLITLRGSSSRRWLKMLNGLNV